MRYAWLVAAAFVSAVAPVSGEWSDGVDALRAGDAAAAADEFARVLAANPFDARAHYMLGISLEKLGRQSLTRTSLGRAFELDQGQDPTIALEYARVLLASSQASVAAAILSALDRRLVVGAERERYALLYAETLSALGKPGEAAALLRREVATDPGDARLYQALGVAYKDRGEYKQALEAFSHAFTLDPASEEYGRSAAYAAVSLARQEQPLSQRRALYERTAVLAQQLVRLTGDATYVLLAAEAWIEAAQAKEARPWLEQAQQVKPGSAIVQYLWARYYHLCGEHDTTLEKLRAALRTGVRGELRRKVYDLLGDIYVAQGSIS